MGVQHTKPQHLPKHASQPFIKHREEKRKKEKQHYCDEQMVKITEFFYVQVTWPQHSGFHKYPVANAHTHMQAQKDKWQL